MAAHLAFELGDSALIYMSGEGAEGLELAPGVILLKAILEHYIENSVSSVDFPRGRESYKRVFGPKEAHLYRVVRGNPESLDGTRPETQLAW